jgi:hypothetical protein
MTSDQRQCVAHHQHAAAHGAHPLAQCPWSCVHDRPGIDAPPVGDHHIVETATEQAQMPDRTEQAKHCSTLV